MNELTLRERLAWFAGIIDGEGSVGAYWTNRGANAKKGNPPSLVFLVTIGNTDIRMIEAMTQIADELGLKYGVCKRKWPAGFKSMWVLTFAGWNRVEGILTHVLPFLVCKREKADIVLAMIRHRRSTWRIKARNARGQVAGMSSVIDDSWLMEQLDHLRSLNKTGMVTNPVSGSESGGEKET